MTGEDRRQLNLHRDSEMLKGFPLEMHGDGDASPLLVDLAGNDRNQLVVANSDGLINAYQYDPKTGALSDLPGLAGAHRTAAAARRRARLLRGGEQSTTAHYDAVIEAPGRRRPHRRRRNGHRRRRPAKATCTRGTRRAS